MSNDWRHLRHRIESCVNEGRYLTKWEQGFLESLTEKMDLGEALTPREREVLERIYVEKVP